MAEDEARRISERTKAALQAAKARGRKLGSPVAAKTVAKARAARSAYAAKANATTLAVIREVQGSGVETLAGIAKVLEAQVCGPSAGRDLAARPSIAAAGSAGNIGPYHCSILHSR